jgi:hypothetical protein
MEKYLEKLQFIIKFINMDLTEEKQKIIPLN